MKVLIVCSINSGIISPFVREQVESLKNLGIEFDFFTIKGKGVFGYLSNYLLYKKKIKIYKPDIIHAHYGFCGFFANFQRRIPVITTFHGSDVNEGKINWLISKTTSFLSKYSIFVSKKLLIKLGTKYNFEIIPCGIDLSFFEPLNKMKFREQLNFSSNKKYVLFSSSFNRPEKNYKLAKDAINLISDVDIELIELKNKSRDEVRTLLNAVDLFLMTSINEGSPQTIKEAMACNCPIVSTDVGDVKDVISGTDSCYITSFRPEDIADKIKLLLMTENRTDGRNNLIKLNIDLNSTAKKISEIYYKILN